MNSRTTVPAPRPLTTFEQVRLDEVLTSARSIGSERRKPFTVLGNELRCALLLLNDNSISRAGDNGHWREKCHVLFARPAAETSQIAFWHRLTDA
ncbi:MAG: hypothetical protein ABL926_02660 [Novosphingobium sp.]|uniref:hypothetical protein n=1 Tax=Novosphingobium sp. TaxID=1874826 RepID=UPI0032B869BB